MRRVLVASAVAAALILSSCGAVGADLYSSVPASAWPQLDGVSVVSSEGSNGNECCEAHVGSRQLVVKLSPDEITPLLGLQQSLVEAGWRPAKCAGTESRTEKVCARTSGFFAVLTVPHSRAEQEEGLIFVDLQRSP